MSFRNPQTADSWAEGWSSGDDQSSPVAALARADSASPCSPPSRTTPARQTSHIPCSTTAIEFSPHSGNRRPPAEDFVRIAGIVVRSWISVWIPATTRSRPAGTWTSSAGGITSISMKLRPSHRP